MSAKICSANFGGKHTPTQVLADALGNAEDIKAVVTVIKWKDGTVGAAWADGEATEMLGMLEYAKYRLCRGRFE